MNRSVRNHQSDRRAGLAFRRLLKRTGCKLEDVSALTPYSYREVLWQSGHGFPSRFFRLAVDDAFGVAVFQTASQFKLRQERKALLGLDPDFANIMDLRALALRIGVSDASRTPRGLLIDALCTKLRLNPHLRPTIPKKKSA